MHEGDHGIMDHTHEELDKKFGQSDPSHSCGSGHQHDHPGKDSDRWIKIVAAFVVLAMISLFVVYKIL